MMHDFVLMIYVTLFAILFEKKGFKWNWFLPLASGFAVATVLAVLGGKGSLVSLGSLETEARLGLLSIPVYILFCPIHAFITVRVMNAIPGNAPFFERMFTKVLVYGAAALAAGFGFAVLSMFGMAAYHLATH